MRSSSAGASRGNQITHEYCLDTGELIVTLAIAFGMVAEMAAIVATLKSK